MKTFVCDDVVEIFLTFVICAESDGVVFVAKTNNKWLKNNDPTHLTILKMVMFGITKCNYNKFGNYSAWVYYFWKFFKSIL